jgi:hypothetical protein
MVTVIKRLSVSTGNDDSLIFKFCNMLQFAPDKLSLLAKPNYFTQIAFIIVK